MAHLARDPDQCVVHPDDRDPRNVPDADEVRYSPDSQSRRDLLHRRPRSLQPYDRKEKTTLPYAATTGGSPGRASEKTPRLPRLRQIVSARPDDLECLGERRAQSKDSSEPDRVSTVLPVGRSTAFQGASPAPDGHQSKGWPPSPPSSSFLQNRLRP